MDTWPHGPDDVVDVDPETDRALLEEVFHRILRPSFVLDELPGLDYLHEGLRTGQHLTALVLDGTPRAAAVWETSAEASGLGLLSYLAVEPEVRGSRFGTRLLSTLTESWRASGRTVLAEVHDPAHHATTATEQPVARLRFYHGCGALALGARWVQPRLSPDTSRVEGMALLCLVDAGHPTGVPASTLRAWAADYYLDSEGGVPHDPVWLALERHLTSRRLWRPMPINV